MSQLLKSVHNKGSNTNRRAIAILFVITGLLSMVFWWKGRGEIIPNNDSGSFWSPLKISYNVESKKADANFALKLEDMVANTEGDYSIFVHRLSEGTEYGINQNEEMPAASIMKVPIMVGAYKHLDQTDEVKEMLRAMGKRSDNQAPVTLINRIGRGNMHQILEEIGMHDSDFDQNTTTAEDVGRMWKMLQKEQQITSDQREEMWQYLTDSIFEERLPAGLPDGVRVVHKVGTDINVWADAGIIECTVAHDQCPIDALVVVILNKGVQLSQAKDLVPKITKTIWEYETSRIGN